MAGIGTPPREKARVYRTGRPDRLCSLLFAVAALILCAGIGAVLWHEWQGTAPMPAHKISAATANSSEHSLSGRPVR